jgi:hypothetical protein
MLRAVPVGELPNLDLLLPVQVLGNMWLTKAKPSSCRAVAS